MLEDIKKILELAVWAPSGDNSQPWEFEIKGEQLFIYNLPDKDNPYLNFKQGGSHIAHGGVIENLTIAAPHFGYRAEVQLFPSASEKNLVAAVQFLKDERAKRDPLFDSIKKRHTNRRPYESTPLASEQRDSVLHTPVELGFGTVRLVEDERKKKIAGWAGAMAEIVILENKLLHSYLFRDVVWTEEEEKKVRHGLYIKTMEFNPIQRAMFRLASNWIIMKLAIRLGLPKFIAKEDTKLYATGGALGIVTMPNSNAEDAVNAGRLMQRVWLKTTQMGLALQPVTATLFFAHRILSGESGDLPSVHVDLMKKSYNDIKEVFNVGNETIYMMFRVGQARPASACSSRISVEEKLLS